MRVIRGSFSRIAAVVLVANVRIRISLTLFSRRNAKSQPGSWVLGNAQRGTNATDITNGVLYSQVGSMAVYRCPADRSFVTPVKSPRLRSYAVEGWLGASFDDWNVSVMGVLPGWSTRSFR